MLSPWIVVLQTFHVFHGFFTFQTFFELIKIHSTKDYINNDSYIHNHHCLFVIILKINSVSNY